MRYKILALSGGGYKGLYTAAILKALEKEAGVPIAEKFDLIAGTSIGGIISLALAIEKPASEIYDLFEQHGSDIFKRNFFRRGLFHAKYTNKKIKNVLEIFFGDAKIQDLKHNVIIPTINFTKGGPQVFKTPHHKDLKIDKDRLLVDVALATSAAPLYFPIYHTSYGDFVDGGIVANHPGLYAIIEAQKFMKVTINDIHQLHIGTLSNKYTSSGSKFLLKSGLLSWRTKLISLIFSCQEQSSDQIIKFLLSDRYISIDELISDEQDSVLGLDKTSKRAKVILNQIAQTSIQNFISNKLVQEMIK